MSIKTDWPATAKSRLIASSERPETRQGHVDIVMVLLAAITLLACRTALISSIPLSLVCVGFALVAMILLISIRRVFSEKSTVWEQLAHDWRTALESAAETAREKEAFIVWANREIRGPLTAILGCCDTPWEPATPTSEENRAIILRNAGQILSVADTVLGCSGKTTPKVVAAPLPTQWPMGLSMGHFSGRVLIAEDAEDNRKVIEFYLQKAGVEYVAVADGKSAYEEALAADKRRQPYDLILMDVQMPIADGCAATIFLRDHQYRAPIVALTANATDRDRERCLAAGFNGFLTKPIDVPKLAAVLGRYLRPAGKIKSSAIIFDALAKEDPGFAALKTSFLGEINTRISAIEKAIAAEDWAAAAGVSHQLSGTAGCYGMTEVSHAAGALQDAAEQATHGADLQRPFADLKELCQLARLAKAA